MSSRRELRAAVGLCLLGSALLLLALSRSWLAYRYAAPAPLPARQLTVAGSQLAPGARALALLGLAGVAALLATRGLARALVGLLVAVAGFAAAAVVVRVLLAPGRAVAGVAAADGEPLGTDLGGWPYVALAGGVLVAAAGLLVVVRGRKWAAMPARYDRPEQAEGGQLSAWDSLDRGEDPTRIGPERGD